MNFMEIITASVFLSPSEYAYACAIGRLPATPKTSLSISLVLQYTRESNTKMIAKIFLVALAFFIGESAAQKSPGAIVVHPPTYSTASTGQTVRMTCAAYGIPTPSITWTRVTTDLAAKLADSNSGYKKYDQTVTVNGTVFAVSVLEICDVGITETDEFTCSADNGISGVGVASGEAKFFLSVTGSASEPPAVIVRPPTDGATVDYGSTIEAVCVAYGNPIPTITWAKGGCTDMSCNDNAKVFNEVVTYSDVSFRKSILQLCNVSESDVGSYSCSAMNGIGGEGVAPSSFSWWLGVNPRPVSSSSSSSSVVVPTTSCPVVTSAGGRGTTTAVSPTVGRQFSDIASERSYQVVVGIETVAIVVLLVAIVVIVLIAVKTRSKPQQKAEIAGPPKNPQLYSVENPIHDDHGDDGIDDDHKDSDTMTYADLAKKMEAES